MQCKPNIKTSIFKNQIMVGTQRNSLDTAQLSLRMLRNHMSYRIVTLSNNYFASHVLHHIVFIHKTNSTRWNNTLKITKSTTAFHYWFYNSITCSSSRPNHSISATYVNNAFKLCCCHNHSNVKAGTTNDQHKNISYNMFSGFQWTCDALFNNN